MTKPEIPTTIEGFKQLAEELEHLKRNNPEAWVEAYRYYSKHSLFFLLRYVLLIGMQAIHSEFGTPLSPGWLLLNSST